MNSLGVTFGQKMENSLEKLLQALHQSRNVDAGVREILFCFSEIFHKQDLMLKRNQEELGSLKEILKKKVEYEDFQKKLIAKANVSEIYSLNRRLSDLQREMDEKMERNEIYSELSKKPDAEEVFSQLDDLISIVEETSEDTKAALQTHRASLLDMSIRLSNYETNPRSSAPLAHGSPFNTPMRLFKQMDQIKEEDTPPVYSQQLDTSLKFHDFRLDEMREEIRKLGAENREKYQRLEGKFSRLNERTVDVRVFEQKIKEMASRDSFERLEETQRQWMKLTDQRVKELEESVWQREECIPKSEELQTLFTKCSSLDERHTQLHSRVNVLEKEKHNTSGDYDFVKNQLEKLKETILSMEMSMQSLRGNSSLQCHNCHSEEFEHEIENLQQKLDNESEEREDCLENLENAWTLKWVESQRKLLRLEEEMEVLKTVTRIPNPLPADNPPSEQKEVKSENTEWIVSTVTKEVTKEVTKLVEEMGSSIQKATTEEIRQLADLVAEQTSKWSKEKTQELEDFIRLKLSEELEVKRDSTTDPPTEGEEAKEHTQKIAWRTALQKLRSSHEKLADSLTTTSLQVKELWEQWERREVPLPTEWEGRWVWNSGQTKSGHGVPWDVQTRNTQPKNFLWEKGKVAIGIVIGGIYCLSFGFFARRSPSVQLLLNGRPLLPPFISQSVSLSGVVQSSARGEGDGVTYFNYLWIPPKSRLAFSYEGDPQVEAFLALQKM